MGIFSRLNRVIKSNLNALIDQAEDPDKMIGQTVTDMKSALKRARKDLIEALGSAKRLDKKERDLEQEAVDWEQKAILALEQDDDDLAREALRRKARAIKEAKKRPSASSRAGNRGRRDEGPTRAHRGEARRPQGEAEDARGSGAASADSAARPGAHERRPPRRRRVRGSRTHGGPDRPIGRRSRSPRSAGRPKA